MKDWAECRAVIGRLDTILEDLRKFGFSLVTGLLTATAFLGLSQISPLVRSGATVAIVALTTALFFLDTYYEALLTGAVERALDLEVMTDELRITKMLSRNVSCSHAIIAIPGLYVGFVAVAAFLGILAAVSQSSPSAMIVVTVPSAPAAVLILWYWTDVKTHTAMDKTKFRSWSDGPWKCRRLGGR